MKHLPSYNVCYHRLGDNTEGTCLITYPTAEPSPTDRINSFNIQDHATKDRSPQQKVDGLTSTKEDILKRKCPNDSDINEAQELLKHDDCQDPSTQNSTSEPSPTDQTPDPSPQQEAWQKIHDITLTKEDRDDVLKRKWLNDSVINAAQDLLKHDHGLLPVESLQNTLLIPIRQSDIVCYEGVQILNSCRNHWITISTVGQSANQPTVRIYDSLNTELPSDTKQEIADLLNTNKSEITFERMPVQQQSNTADCGVFAIAFATAICNGQDPEKLQFKTSGMREHLHDCLEDKKMWQFPAKLINKPTPG